MIHTLNKRLIISHLLVALASVALVYAFASRTIFQSAVEQTEHRMEDLAFAVSNALEEPMEDLFEGNASLASVQTVIAHWLADEEDLDYAVYLPDGTPVVNNDGASLASLSVDSAPEIFLALESKLGEGDVIRPNTDGIDMIYVAVRIEHEDEILGVLRLGTPLQIAWVSARNSLITLLVFAIVIIFCVGIAGWLLARNLAKPIEHLTRVARKLSAGDLSVRAKPTGPDEFQRLAETFNNMGAQLQENINKLRDFVANASHELRTPLTTIKLRVEALLAGATNDPKTAQRFLTDIDSEVDRLSHMVNDLLDLSRIEAGMERKNLAQTDLATLVSETCDMFSVRAQKSRIKLFSEQEPDIPSIMANEDQLRRVLDNLVANAIHYTPEGGQVCIHLYLAEKSPWVHVNVSDTGVGIPPVHVEHIFKRFYRADRTRAHEKRAHGTGLGLAIVKSIIEAHEGIISATSELGKGTTFHIKLPLLQQSAKD